MVSCCCIKGCKNRSSSKNKDRFYSFPNVWSRYPKMQEFAKKRLKLWIQATRRKTIDSRHARVCSRHFISGEQQYLRSKILIKSSYQQKRLICLFKGKSAKLQDYRNPDWVPTLHLGHGTKIISLLAKRRLESQRRRELKLKENQENIKEELVGVKDEAEDAIESEKPAEEEFLEDYLDDDNSDDFEMVLDENKTQKTGINCCVPNCKNVRTKKHSRVKFFRFPSATQIINGKEYRNERLSAWINAIKRIDITHLNAQYKIICFEHFITGAPANANDKSHVDWIPNKKLPKALRKALNKIPDTKTKNTLDAFDQFDPLAEVEIQMDVSGNDEMKILPNSEIENMKKEIQQLRLENATLKKHLTEKDLIIGEQKAKLLNLIESHKLELHEKDAAIQLLETANLKISLSKEGFRNDDKKVNYFTGLPSFAVLEIVFNFVQKELHSCMLRRINKFDAFILVLLKLRLDLPLAYLGWRYGIAGQTAATIFHTNLKMLSEKIGPFIRWPEKTALRENTSVYFRRVLGNKFTALLDFIDDPGPNVSPEYIEKKNYIKNKYLIAISPAGAITFVSKGYDSSLSVKEIAESCGVLDYTDDGDIILSDHGTATHHVYSYNGSKVLVQSTNQEENDFLDSLLQNANQSSSKDPAEADSSRIYIQRTISNLMNKFCILRNKQSVNIEKSYKTNDGERYFDHVVKVCCALANVSPAVLTLETKKS